MKKTRRMLALLICTALMLVPGASAMAQSVRSVQADIRISREAVGRIVAAQDITAAFSGKAPEATRTTAVAFAREIQISGNQIQVRVQLHGGELKRALCFRGTLFRSWRWSARNAVYVAALKSDDPAYRCAYFEISHQDSPYQLNAELRNRAAITFYVVDAERRLLDLGGALDTAVDAAAVQEMAPAESDFSWYLGLIEGRYAEEGGIAVRSTYDDVWAGDLHSLYFQIAEYEHRYLAVPYVDFCIGDVGTGATVWWMALKITESAAARRVGTNVWIPHTGYYTRCFLIDNAQLAWTAGGNTNLTYVQPRLNCSAGSHSFHFTALVGLVSAILPQTATVGAILCAADAIINPSYGQNQNYMNNVGGGFSGGAYKMKFPSHYYIDLSGYNLPNLDAERFELAVFATTQNSNLASHYETYANADFTFRLAWSDLSGNQSGTRIYTSNKLMAYLNNA